MRPFRFIAVLAAVLAAPALAQQSQKSPPPFAPYWSTAPATAALPAAGVPPLPAWSLKAPGAKPIMGSIDKHPMLDGPNIVDLKAIGYVEEEYFLTGKANIYALEASTAAGVNNPAPLTGIARADVPYTTRIIVRRPVDAAKFSGNVVMEPSRDVNEWTTSWPAAAAHMLAHGDVFVTFTMAAGNLPAFFYGYDKARYGAIKISDEGLRWDIMAQTAGLIRGADGPLAKSGLLARAAQLKGGLKVISTGASLTAGMQASFIDKGFHARARAANGGPAIDGYLLLVGGRPRDLPNDAAVISLISEGDVARPLAAPRPSAADAADQDGKNGDPRFRWYEMAGTSHANWADQSQFTPAFQLIGAKEQSTVKCATPISTAAVKNDYATAAIVNLEAWLRDGTSPPPGRVLETDGMGTIKRDPYGNAMGGLRPYWIEVPTTRVFPFSQEVPEFAGIRATGGLCGMFAHEMRLSPVTLGGLYKDHATYVARLEAHLKSQVAARYLLAGDAARELAAAKDANVP